MHEITKIRDNVFHVQEAKNTCFTVITGSENAIVFDTGHGAGDNREFVESLVSTPYIVINSHGHPDHTQGNWQFDEVWMHPLDMPAFNDANRKEQRGRNADRLIAGGELDPGKRQEFVDREVPVPSFLNGDERYDLGDLHPYLVMLPGHTKGELGMVIPEHRLLLSGDAFGNNMAMSLLNHDTLEAIHSTLERALTLPVDTFLGTHTHEETDIAALQDLIDTLDKGRIDPDSREVLFGEVVYRLSHPGIIFEDCGIMVSEEQAKRYI
ncbi:MAG: MBL fold metallo-hydrolase [Oscillospiraceae bacterium]|nr:MBL fold metallo-hydrolase [Oscillospiraceae bacterium]